MGVAVFVLLMSMFAQSLGAAFAVVLLVAVLLLFLTIENMCTVNGNIPLTTTTAPVWLQTHIELAQENIDIRAACKNLIIEHNILRSKFWQKAVFYVTKSL